MDFLQILELAQVNQTKNDHSAEVSRLRKAKKVPEKQVSEAAVKAVLKRKADAQKQREEEEKRKKAELMELRVKQNRMGTVRRMLNQSKKKMTLMEVEGIDDSDDYSEAKTEKSSTGKGCKSNVSAAQKVTGSSSQGNSHSKHKSRDTKTKTLGRKEKTEKKAETSSTHDVKQEKLLKVTKKPVKRNTVPPPMSYTEILRLAISKQDSTSLSASPKSHEVDEKEAEKKEPKKESPGRPLTQEEKDRLARTQTKEYQDWLQFGTPLPAEWVEKYGKNTSKKRSRGPSPPTVPEKVTKTENYNEVHETVLVCSESASKPPENTPGLVESGEIRKPGTSKRPQGNQPKSQTSPEPLDVSSIQQGRSSQGHHVQKFTHRENPRKVEPQYEDSDVSDEDDYLSDFIDDSEEMDVSREIREIFGYDKRKYLNDDDDDRQMEASWGDIIREEKRSEKIGREEDLEDMRREEEELRRKAARRKQYKK